MFPLAAAIASAVICSPKPADDPGCRTVARGATFLVHTVEVGPRVPAFAGWAKAPPGWMGAFPVGGRRFAVLYTNTATGRMAKLVEGGTWTLSSPPMGLDRSRVFAVGIGGVAADADRLYVLILRADAEVFHVGRESTVPKFGEPEHVLFVFRLADGTLAQELVLPKQTVPIGSLHMDFVTPDVFALTKTSLKVGTAEFRIEGQLTPAKPGPPAVPLR